MPRNRPAPMSHHEDMRTLGPAAATAVLLLLAPACGTSSSGGPSNAPSAGGTGIVVSLELTQTTVPVGTTINATLVIDNLTGRTVKPGCGVKYAVGLTNGQFPFHPAFPAYCAANQLLSTGKTRYPVTIATTYPGCSQSGQPDGAMPGCLPGPMGGGSRFSVVPPLPKGTYRTAVVLTGPPSELLHLPAPVTVTLD